MKKIFATIDLGSNSFHLRIDQVDTSGNIFPLVKQKEKVQLRAGLLENHSLSEKAQARALTCLGKFAETMSHYTVDAKRAVGTYTLRTLQNSDHFFKAAENTLGCPIEVISGEEEARLIYVGASTANQLKSKTLVIDIGGGSTELIIGEKGDIYYLVSLEMGCVSFQTAFFKNRGMTKLSFDAAIAKANELLHPYKGKLLEIHWDVCIGMSGTIQSISNVLSAAGWLPHHIDLKGLLTIQERLIEIKEVDKISLTGLRGDRASILAGGLSILIALFETLSIKQLRLSHGGIREGVLYELVQKEMKMERK